MRIVHLLYESYGDSFGVGGVGMRAYEIYRHLRDRHEVTVVCKRYPGARDAEIEGLRHVFVGIEGRSLATALLAYAVGATRFVRRHGAAFDVVIEEFAPPIPTFLHRFTTRPLVLQVQGFTGRHYFRKYDPASAAVLAGLERLRPRFYRNLIVPDRHTAARLRLGRDARVAIVPNGVAPEQLRRPPSQGDYILYLGRIDPYSKGLDTLLGAYPAFHAAHPGIRLVVAGAGRAWGRFAGMLRRLPRSVRESIETPGWVTGEQKAKLLGDARFVVVPSRHEVNPIGVLEAMASAKPLLVSDIPAFRELVEHGAAVPFPAGDADALGRAMIALAARPDLCQMGARGRDWVKNDTWDSIAVRFEAAVAAAWQREGRS